jgi:predicted nucleic acid-binding protein
MYLLDTRIVVEIGKAKSGGTDPGLAAWAAGVDRQRLFVSAIALLELDAAAAHLARRDRSAGGVLQAWIDDRVMAAFEGRILPVDAPVARRRAQLAYPDSRNGLLAATALVHGLTLVTRNLAAFRAGRVRTFDPWGYVPDAGDEDSDWRQAARTGSLWLKNLFVRT